MSRKRRMFDIDLPVEDVPVEVVPEPAAASTRRGPMATAIGETGEALRQRATVEADIRAENDALAHEFVRLKKLGLITDMIPVDAIATTRLIRDRGLTSDLDLADLKQSIRDLGLSNPIRVEPDGQGGYQLIQGLRRLSAWKELRAETGDPAWDRIPAGLMVVGETLDTLYRRMVDENLVRKDISFAEMAKLARAYAADPETDCKDVDVAVNVLFASAAPQKRSYIRRFARLMAALDQHLAHPEAIPRALGLDLADRLDADTTAQSRIVHALKSAPDRTADQELALLKAALAQPVTVPGVRKLRGAPRRGRVSLSVPVGPGVRCTATDGKLELRAALDFGGVERQRLEAAIEAFFAKLSET